MIIAIDGLSSCGKSTIAKSVAKTLGIHYVDSGAAYRAVTLFCLQNKIQPLDEIAVAEVLPRIQLDLIPEIPVKVFLNGKDVTEEIRKPEVSKYVSEISKVSPVRRKVVEWLREFAKENSLVMDGRDIGSVVFPNADYKFFVRADDSVRAQRRLEELIHKGISINYEEVLENLLHRDLMDSTRADSPLIKTPDALEVDTTHLSPEQQLILVLRHMGH
ncbi:MAG: (d)CMP kinase [Saprospiraceae bacterium]|nr:(d)CMP kinase [Saprospiraceae bacterium]